MSKNFDIAIRDAYKQDFLWLNDFQNPYVENEFSSQFETHMKDIVSKAENKFTLVHNKRRMRKRLLIVLIALMTLAIAGYVVAERYAVRWNEAQNDEQGTLDVTFEVDESLLNQEISVVLPSTPLGYSITDRQGDEDACVIEYSNAQGELIGYSHVYGVENMSVSIDNEDVVMHKTWINGNIGYTHEKEGLHTLMWTDGIYFYSLQGTCEAEILWEMAESMVK